MGTTRLGQKNIDLLLSQYRSERKRLIFQLDKVRNTIAELKAARDNDAPESGSDIVKRGPGRPRKNAAKKVTAKKGRRKKRQVSKEGYRLSPWDEMVLTNIEKAGLLLPKEDILKQAKVWAKKHESKMTAADVEEKITRVLQKLSGKRGMLGTHRSGLRRGYHYGLKDWFFATSGKLRGQHLDKLVLS